MECNVKFWLPKDLYNSLLAYSFRKCTTMSRLLRICVQAIQEVLREEFLQEELRKKNTPPQPMPKMKWEDFYNHKKFLKSARAAARKYAFDEIKAAVKAKFQQQNSPDQPIKTP